MLFMLRRLKEEYCSHTKSCVLLTWIKLLDRVQRKVLECAMKEERNSTGFGEINDESV